MKNIKIGNFETGKSQRPLVIAEAGINHNGNIAIALEMIKTAKACGRDVFVLQRSGEDNRKAIVRRKHSGGVYDGQVDSFQKAYSERIPLGRMAVWSDYNGAILF